MKTDNAQHTAQYYLKNVVTALLLSVTAVVFFIVYEKCVSLTNGTLAAEVRRVLPGALLNGRSFIAAGVIGLGFFILLCKGKKAADFLYSYRYLICLILFACCVALQLNGSSIGMWSDTLGQPESGVLAGVSRYVRSDEWFASTPMAFSQYFDYPRAFSYFGSVLRGMPTDMFLEYGQPVRDIAVIFRPFHWGYLFLPPAYGLSFYWCGRLFGLFLASFEFGMLITKRNRILSLAFSLLVGLAPVVQWWFAINGLVEMLFFLQIAVLLLKKYLETDSRGKRAGLLAGIFLCAGGYILTMYPAWMIPLGYILAGTAAGIFLTSFSKKYWKRADVLVLAVEAAVFLVLMGYIFYRSRGTIESLMNTKFPGRRFFTGGEGYSTSTNYVANIWYAIFGYASYINECESARFFDFFPVCYLPLIWCLVKEKCRDKLLLILLAVSLFLEVYAIFGFSPALARVTLLSNCSSQRIFAVVGFCNLILLFRGLGLIREHIRLPFAIVGGVVLSVFCVQSNARVFPDYYMHAHLNILAITLVLMALLYVALLMTGKQRGQLFFLAMVSVMMILSGSLVNPVRRGISNIYESETLRQIREVKEEDPEALWIVEGEDVPVINLPILVGARTVTCTNVYPALERWRALDGGAYDEIYNRYANVCIDLNDADTAVFSLLRTDCFQLTCSPAVLKQIGVRYILTENDLSRYPELLPVSSWDTYRIYELAE